MNSNFSKRNFKEFQQRWGCSLLSVNLDIKLMRITRVSQILDERFRPLSRFRLFDAVIRRTAPLLVSSCLVATPWPDFQFDYDSAVCAVYDAPAARDGPWWELYCARRRRSSPRPFSYFPETSQCEPYVTRKPGGTRNTVKSPCFYLDRESGRAQIKFELHEIKKSARQVR